MNILERIKKREKTKSPYLYTISFNTDVNMHKKAIQAISRFQNETSLNIKDAIIQMLATYYTNNNAESEIYINKKEERMENINNNITEMNNKQNMQCESEKKPQSKTEQHTKKEKEKEKQDASASNIPKGFQYDPEAQAKLRKLINSQYEDQT